MRIVNDNVNNYMMMPKDFLRNPRLSLEAKGVMSMLCYFTDMGVMGSRIIELICSGNTDKNVLLKGFKELSQEGYLITIPVGEEISDLDDDLLLEVNELPRKIR